YNALRGTSRGGDSNRFDKKRLDRWCDAVDRMQLPKSAQRRVAAAVLDDARSTIGRRLLMETVEQGGTGEPYPHRRIEIAAGTESRGVHEGRERRTSLAVHHTVALRRNLDDEARSDGRGRGLGELDVPVAVGLVQLQASDPADHGEHAVLAA